MRLRHAQYLRWLMLPALAISLQASASVEQQLAQCAAIKDKLDRLVCYDELAAQTITPTVTKQAKPGAQVVTPAASVTAPVTAKATKPATPEPTAALSPASEQNFGKVARETPQEIDRISAKVASIQKGLHGGLTIKLDNGQVWKQNGADRFRLKVGETVYIEKGTLGSFFLGKESANATIRVKRID
ncbi:hypothetical protein LZP69_12210 [Shewanella sp. AS1]|uniref:hypothetical protein n=1 Tax=Shewanella sp. AS1 TaxID=2907626 RepID=UPI001F439C43|nr:hypothetical protein [Shewanella sp. AS1]MCE9679927.1 hypothetical protein [Shewanella sp. AS1]